MLAGGWTALLVSLQTRVASCGCHCTWCCTCAATFPRVDSMHSSACGCTLLPPQDPLSWLTLAWRAYMAAQTGS